MKKLCFIFVVSILLVSTCFNVGAYSGDLFTAANGSTPTIDGSIVSGEWADAAIIAFTARSWSITAYVKQDANNLYIAVDLPDNTPCEFDSIALYFDVDHDDGDSLQSDDIGLEILRPLPTATLEEYYGSGGPNGFWVPTSLAGWTAAATSTASAFQAEFSIPYSKISVTFGVAKILGILFCFADEYPRDGGTNAVWYSWPFGPSAYKTPSDWAEIVVGHPTFVIPELWQGTILGVTGCFAAFGAYYISKRRRIFL